MIPRFTRICPNNKLMICTIDCTMATSSSCFFEESSIRFAPSLFQIFFRYSHFSQGNTGSNAIFWSFREVVQGPNIGWVAITSPVVYCDNTFVALVFIPVKSMRSFPGGICGIRFSITCTVDRILTEIIMMSPCLTASSGVILVDREAMITWSHFSSK